MKRRDLILLVLSLALIVFSAVQIIRHFTEIRAGEQTEQEMRGLYHAEDARETEIPTLTPQPEQAADTVAPTEFLPTEEPPCTTPL